MYRKRWETVSRVRHRSPIADIYNIGSWCPFPSCSNQGQTHQHNLSPLPPTLFHHTYGGHLPP